MTEKADQPGYGKERDVPLAKGPEVLPPPHPTRESKKTRAVVAFLGAALLFGPWAAYGLGARSQPVPGENRALAGRPQIDGFNTFNQITAYAADHFPLRDAAIRANKELINDVFSEPPSYFGSAGNQQVLFGQGKWLFFSDDFNKACSPEIQLDQVIAGVKRLNQMLADSGRRLIITVPPDKSTVESQYLPKAFELKQCSEIAKERRWKAIRSMGVPGYVDVRSAVEHQEKDKGKPAFLEYVTHWTQDSAVTFVEIVVKRIDPTLLEHTKVQAGQVYKENGDLDILANGPSPKPKFDFQAVYIVRDGVTPKLTEEPLAPQDGYTISHVTSTSAGAAALFQPRVTWIGDSFTQRALGHPSDGAGSSKIAPFFADLVRVPELTKAILANTAKNDLYHVARRRMIQEIVAGKVTVLELVERTFAGVGGLGSMFSDTKDARSGMDFLDELQVALDKAPQQ
ncbi:MAG: hypothetical protein JWO22_3003 [Frankiales bacterium]|nr:hypothetical protein [Frankiales bacterium]